MELSLQTRTVADRTVLEVGGEIDVYTAPRLKERLLELVADGTRQIVVDLEAVEFLDSTGLGVLVGGLRRIRAQGGHLALVCTQERILKIFRITGLATFFDIYPSVEAAGFGEAAGDAVSRGADTGRTGNRSTDESAGGKVASGDTDNSGDQEGGDASAGAPPAPGS